MFSHSHNKRCSKVVTWVKCKGTGTGKGKGKSPVLNLAPHHEGIWGEETQVHQLLNSALHGSVVSFMPRPLRSRGNSPLNSVNSRLNKPRGAGALEKGKVSRLCQESNHTTSGLSFYHAKMKHHRWPISSSEQTSMRQI